MTLSEFDGWFRTRYSRTSSAPVVIAFIFSDLLGVMASFGIGFGIIETFSWIWLGDGSLINLRSFVTYWPYLPIFIVVFQMFGMYPGISLAPSEELRRFALGSAMAFGGIAISRLIERQVWDEVNTAFMFGLVVAPFVLLTLRGIINRVLRRLGKKGIPAVVYGSGDAARLIIDRLRGSPKIGYAPVLILDDEPGGEDEYAGVPIIRDTSVGPEIVRRYGIKMAIVAMEGRDRDDLKRLLIDSAAAFRYLVIIPDFFRSANIWMSVRDFNGLLGFVAGHKLNMPWNLWIKRFFDIAVVAVGGLLLLPFLLLVALLVKLSSPGPVLYGHKRLGRGGKPFYALKFRSMAADAPERLEKLLASDPDIRKEWEMNHKLKNDPRVTQFGRFLRVSSIDEFPQFLNILRGDMSLVGPRPITEGEVEKYGGDFSWIFSVKPGLTGLWQVSGRSQSDYVTRVSYDTYYLQSWSLWLDSWIVYKTFGAVVRGRGAY